MDYQELATRLMDVEDRYNRIEERLDRMESSISGAFGAIKLAAWATPICLSLAGLLFAIVQVYVRFL